MAIKIARPISRSRHWVLAAPVQRGLQNLMIVRAAIAASRTILALRAESDDGSLYRRTCGQDPVGPLPLRRSPACNSSVLLRQPPRRRLGRAAGGKSSSRGVAAG